MNLKFENIPWSNKGVDTCNGVSSCKGVSTCNGVISCNGVNTCNGVSTCNSVRILTKTYWPAGGGQFKVDRVDEWKM